MKTIKKNFHHIKSLEKTYTVNLFLAFQKMNIVEGKLKPLGENTLSFQKIQLRTQPLQQSAAPAAR